MHSRQSLARLAVIIPVALGLLVFAGWRAPASPPATAAPAVYDPIVIPHGVDLLKADGTLHLSLPAGFFASGSSPYSGDLACTGVPLKTSDAFELGTTTMVLTRESDTTLPWPPAGAVQVFARVAEFGLTGNSNITVTVGGATQSWSVSASLSASAPTGCSYSVTRVSSTAGTFTASLVVPISLIFKRGTQAKILDLGQVTIGTSTGTWTTLSGSVSSALAVGGLPLGLAMTATSFTSSEIDVSVSPAAINPGRPGPAYVDPTATIDSAVGSLGRYCSIGAHAVIDAGAVVGPYATIASFAHVGTNAVVGDHASIGANATVSSDAFVDTSCVIGSGTTIGGSCVIEQSATIGANCSVGASTFMGGSSVVQDDCTIGSSCKVFRGTQIGTLSAVSNDLRIDAGATIASSTSVTQSLFKCYHDDGTVEYKSAPQSGWTVGPPYLVVFGTRECPEIVYMFGGTTTKHRSTLSNPPAGGFGNLPSDIGKMIASPINGGLGYTYIEGWFMCSWFSQKLGERLKTAGYTTTFTIVNELNPDWKWSNRQKVKKWLTGHTFTDVHWADGTTTWIEAQKPDEKGIDAGVQLLMDGNHDGDITYTDGFNSNEPTDGNLNVRVYSSRDAADAAGDGNPGSPEEGV